MKNFLWLGLVCMFISSNLCAQEFSIGIKGGIGYAHGATIYGKSSFVDGRDFYSTGTFNSSSKLNFHGGGFAEIRFGRFLIRPEVLYNSMETEFEFVNLTSIYKQEKISIPLLFGYNVYGPIDIFAGPAYQNVLEASLENIRDGIVVQNSPLALQVGVKARFGSLEIDLRYDRNLSSEELQDIDVEDDSTVTSGMSERDGVNFADFDGRLHQILLSVSYKIFDSEREPSRKGGNCYF